MSDSKKLKTLEEHNHQRYELNKRLNSGEPILNGIACPECGAELYDSDPCGTLLSYPPKKDVHCSKCDYKGYRVK